MFPAGMLVLAVALSACFTPPTQSTTTPALVAQTTPSTTYGNSGHTTYTQISAPPPPLAGGKVDPDQSKALTEYLKTHHLPLVGAQVLAAPGGQRQVILFGYVATAYGKGDADSRVHRYLNDPSVSIDNRIKVEPSLVNSGSPSSSTQQADDPSNLSGVQAYENQRYEDQVQQQQAYQYQNQGPSTMSTIAPLMGMFMPFGGAGIGIGGGGFHGGYGGGGFSSYPVPTAPPPSYPPSSYYP